MWRQVLVVVAAVVAAVCGGAVSRGANRYGFYRAVEGEESGRRSGAGSARRVFGGRAATRDAWPAACVLLDRYMGARCSASVLADHWALTAAHCVTPSLAYVQYNSDRPAAGGGDTAPVLVLYRHPGYRVKQEDLGRGQDVTLLHHDVGLVRTRNPMRLKNAPALNPLRALSTYSMRDVVGDEVQVLGFGRTSESAAQGERLVEGRLRVVACERGSWVHCICGTASREQGAVGVCAGDSGGPVVYRGTQVAVTSMGPVECREGGGGEHPDETATSVFTALSEYAPLINDTILETENAMRMSLIAHRSAADVDGAATLDHHMLQAFALAIALHIVTFCLLLGQR